MFVLTVLLIAALAEGGIVRKDKCDEPLGMENGRITNAQLSASSSYEINSVGPLQARLNNNNGGGAWCPKSFISETSGVDEFLEIDLGEEHSVTGVVTQGRFANGLGQEFAEFFLVQFWKPGMEDFSDYKDSSGVELFTGNRDTYTEVETRFEPALVASRVRIIPFSYHPRTVCMRVELKGCKSLKPGIVRPTTSIPYPPLEERNDETEFYEIVTEPEVKKTENVVKKNREHMVEVDLHPEIPDHKIVVLEPWWETEYMGIAVGILVTVIFILISIIVFILYKNYKNHTYSDNSQYYTTQIPKFDQTESQWPDRKLTIGRKLPPTPTTSEELYTDSSAEYSSPLLTSNCRQQIYSQTKPHPNVNWESFFPSPPPGAPPRLHGSMRPGYMAPVNHYAATDVINPGAKIYGKNGGATYFL